MARALARTLTTAALCAGLAVPVVATGGSVLADPGPAVATLTCGSTTYEIALGDGQGEFTPAHDANSNAVFVPTAFGDFHGEVYDAEGVLVDSFTEEGDAVKGSSGKSRPTVECTYLFDDVSDGSDPEFPVGYRLVGSGEVTGYWSR
jgi:hypothetical protein